jgi:neutral ceramidase
LGEQFLWLTLGGEVVVDYSLKFKGEFGYDTWVTAYANDVMAYIPSARVRLEGGYEGQSSMIVYGQPSERWAADVEDRLTAGVRRVVARVQGEGR